jgi:hypothetical protein
MFPGDTCEVLQKKIYVPTWKVYLSFVYSCAYLK